MCGAKGMRRNDCVPQGYTGTMRHSREKGKRCPTFFFLMLLPASGRMGDPLVLGVAVIVERPRAGRRRCLAGPPIIGKSKLIA